MYGLLCKNTFKGIILFFCVPWVLLGCGDFDREFGAGGSDKSGSLFNVEDVDPIYFDELTNQVDVVQDNCAAPGEDPDPEEFTDHYAEISVTNRPLVNADEQTASWIYLRSYEIHYTAVTQGTVPFLSTNVIPISESVGLEPCQPGSSCQEESFIAEMVPLTEKAVLNQYLQENPTVFQLQYNVHYVVFGENDFGEPVSADGFTNFYATNYDNCGG
jgi:hypothetical protein